MGAEATTATLSWSRPGIPDFTKVSSIDLIKGIVIIDGLEFEIGDKTVLNDLRMFCVETATAAITRKVAEAVARFRIEATNEGQETPDAQVQSPAAQDGERTETQQSPTTHLEPHVPASTTPLESSKPVKARKRRTKSV